MKKFYENDLEEIIYTTEREKLKKNGLPINKEAKLLRQVKIGKYGIADLIAVNKEYGPYHEPYLNITVIELKESKIGISAFLQAVRYVRGIQSYFSKRDFYRYKIGIWLMGSSLDTTGSFCYLTDLIVPDDMFSPDHEPGLDHYCTYIYDYKFDGIKFKDVRGLKLKDEGF